MSKTIDDLREHLFAAIQGVRDGSVSIEQAKTISDLSQVIVNTAKVEVDFVRATERRESRFLGAPEAAGQSPDHALPKGILGVRRHLLRDD
jgi:hypothetical protein